MIQTLSSNPPVEVPPVTVAPATNVDDVVRRYYPNLLSSVHASLAVFGAMAIANRTKPLSLIFETPSGFGKTAVLQMGFPLDDGLRPFVYRSDKFTPKSFVSHAANVKPEQLAKMDLLPKLENRVLITKELAPLFRGREAEMEDNFSMLISVLDGKGFTSDTGMRGQRGYDRSIIFNWLGATTPLPANTHRMMSQLGTRLLFFEVPAIEPTEADLLRYAKRNDAGMAEVECQRAVNDFLETFFTVHPIGSVDPDTITFPEDLLTLLVKWSLLLVRTRAEVKFEKSGSEWQPVAARPPEGPFKVINYLKELAWGHALTHGRKIVTPAELDFVAEVALASVPGHLRPIVRRLRHTPTMTSSAAARLCYVSPPTARKYLTELALLGFGQLQKGSTTDPDTLELAPDFAWLRSAQQLC